MKDLSDKELLRKISENNNDAFDVLFKRYYGKLCRFSHAYSNDKSSAEEIVQAVFVQIWEKRKSIKSEIIVQSYLYAMVKNLSISNLVSDRKRMERERIFGKDNIIEENTAEKQKKIVELRKYVTEAIKQLPQKCKTVYVLSKRDGLTYGEIAKYMNLNQKTVENQMGIAFKKIREFVNAQNIEISF